MRYRLGFEIIWIHEHGDRGSIWNQVTQDCQLLARNRSGEKADTRDIAVWSTDVGDESRFDRVAASGKDNRYCRGCSFCGKRRRRAPACENNGNLTIDQLGRQGGKPIGTLVRPSIFDGNVLTFEIAGFSEAFTEGRH
jgi:hypothetical protein